MLVQSRFTGVPQRSRRCKGATRPTAPRYTSSVLQFVWICVGGAVGTGARYLVGIGLARALGAKFPWGTLAVNVLGCLAMGLLLAPTSRMQALDPTVRLALTTGVLGGFTTYSAYNHECLRFAQTGHLAAAAGYVALTLAVCFAAGVTGIALARQLG